MQVRGVCETIVQEEDWGEDNVLSSFGQDVLAELACKCKDET